MTVSDFKVNRIVTCLGNSLWMDSKDIKIKVERIRIEQEIYGGWFLVWVYHDGPWEIYTDRGFEKAISAIVSKKLGVDVKIEFTEQGMQEAGIASMEPASKRAKDILTKRFKEVK